MEAWGGRTVARGTLRANHASRAPEGGWPLPLSALICGPDGGKTPRKGVEMAIFSGTCYVANNGATPVLQPIMPLDLPVKVRSWELTVYPRSHIRRWFGVTRPAQARM